MFDGFLEMVGFVAVSLLFREYMNWVFVFAGVRFDFCLLWTWLKNGTFVEVLNSGVNEIGGGDSWSPFHFSRASGFLVQSRKMLLNLNYEAIMIWGSLQNFTVESFISGSLDTGGLFLCGLLIATSITQWAQ